MFRVCGDMLANLLLYDLESVHIMCKSAQSGRQATKTRLQASQTPHNQAGTKSIHVYFRFDDYTQYWRLHIQDEFVILELSILHLPLEWRLRLLKLDN